MKLYNLIVMLVIMTGTVTPLAGSGECGSYEYVTTSTWGGSDSDGDQACGISVGMDGSVVAGGDFNGTVDFDPGSGLDERVGIEGDGFASAYSSNLAYSWTWTLGAELSDSVNSVQAGPAFVVLGGAFSSTVDFDPIGEDLHTAGGSDDAFLTTLGVNGDYGWTRTWGGSDLEKSYSHAVAVSYDGAIAVTGDFGGTTDLDPDPDKILEVYNAGSYDVYLSIFDDQGNLNWAVSFGGADGDTAQATGFMKDGSVFVCGSFEETVDFDPSIEGIDEHVSLGGDDVYVAKFGAEGDFKWVRTFGGSDEESASDGAWDAEGSSFLAGSFQQTVDFDPGDGVWEATSAGDSDGYVIKLDPAGDFVWALSFGGLDTETVNSLDIDESGNIVVTGEFGDLGGPAGYSVDFDPGPDEDWHYTRGNRDIFVTYLNADGSYGWTWTAGGIGWDTGLAVAFGANSQIHVTGYFKEVADFDLSGPGDIHQSNGGRDVFLTTLKCIDNPPPCEGDVNGDSTVDPLDSGFVMSRFDCPVGGGDDECDAADANADLVVDPLDVGYVLSRFGSCE